MSDHPNTNDQRTRRTRRQSPNRAPQESYQNVASAGLHIEADRAEGALIVRVSGALRFPAAMELTRAVESLLDQGAIEVTVLDLSQLTDVDHTGIAVLVAAGRTSKRPGARSGS